MATLKNYKSFSGFGVRGRWSMQSYCQSVLLN